MLSENLFPFNNTHHSYKETVVIFWVSQELLYWVILLDLKSNEKHELKIVVTYFHNLQIS